MTPSPTCLTTQNCSISTTDGSSEGEDYPGGFNVRVYIFPIIIAVLIVAINSWVIGLVAMKRSLRTVTNYILASLALSDLCTGAISIPLLLSCNATLLPGVCVADMVAVIFTSVSTVLHILTMTIDRYICIIYALRYQIWVTKRRGWYVIALIWLFSLFMALIQLAWTDPNQDPTEDRDPKVEEIFVIYDSFRFVAFIGIPVLFMAFTYGRIMYEVHRQTKNIHKNNTPGWQETRRSTRREWKVATIFLAMMIVFLVCWVPFYLLRLEQILQDDFFQLNLSELAIVLLYWLRLCTSVINPCLYILAKPDFRKAMCSWRKKHRRNNSADLSSHISIMKSSAV